MRTDTVKSLVALTGDIYRLLLNRWPDYSVREYEMKVALAYRVLNDTATPTGQLIADEYASESSETRAEWAESMVSQELFMLASLKKLCGFERYGKAELEAAEKSAMPEVVAVLAQQARESVSVFTESVTIQANMVEEINKWELDALTIAGSETDTALDLELPA